MSKQKIKEKPMAQPIAEPPRQGQTRAISDQPVQSHRSGQYEGNGMYEEEPPRRLNSPQDGGSAVPKRSTQVSALPKVSRVSEVESEEDAESETVADDKQTTPEPQ